MDEQTEQIKSLERQLQPSLSSTEQHPQRKKPRLTKKNDKNNINNNQDNHSQTLQKKKKVLERELASLQTKIDQDTLNYEEIKSQRGKIKKGTSTALALSVSPDKKIIRHIVNIIIKKMIMEHLFAAEAEEAKKQKEKREEENAATSSGRMNDHAPTRTNDQTMTTEVRISINQSSLQH